MSLKNLGAKERALLNLYANCQFGMSPGDFYAKWNVTHTQMAQICGCSESTVDRWFQKGRGYQPPELVYQRRLAEIDFIWEHYEELPPELWQLICGDTRPSL